MGKSGMGKSTMAYDLLMKDFKLITEDICAINQNEILHSYSLLKLSNSSYISDMNLFEINTTSPLIVLEDRGLK